MELNLGEAEKASFLLELTTARFYDCLSFVVYQVVKLKVSSLSYAL